MSVTRAALGISPSALGPGREVRRWTQGQAGTGNTRLTKAATSQEAWPEAEPRTTTRPLGENRGGTPVSGAWNADRCAPPVSGARPGPMVPANYCIASVAFCFRFFSFFPVYSFRSSLSDIAVRRTASLRSAYARQSMQMSSLHSVFHRALASRSSAWTTASSPVVTIAESGVP